MGDMMKSLDRFEDTYSEPKRGSVSPVWRGWSTAVLLVGLAMVLGGCCHYARPGETAAERSLRHKRVLRVNCSQMMDDIDKLLMLDRPSGRSEYRLP